MTPIRAKVERKMRSMPQVSWCYDMLMHLSQYNCSRVGCKKDSRCMRRWNILARFYVDFRKSPSGAEVKWLSMRTHDTEAVKCEGLS